MKALYWFCECGNVESRKPAELVRPGISGDLVVRVEPCFNCKRTMLLIEGDWLADKAKWEAYRDASSS